MAAISGGSTLGKQFNNRFDPLKAIVDGIDCLATIGGSTAAQNSLVLVVRNFCAEGDPFKPVSEPEAPSTTLLIPFFLHLLTLIIFFVVHNEHAFQVRHNLKTSLEILKKSYLLVLLKIVLQV